MLFVFAPSRAVEAEARPPSRAWRLSFGVDDDPATAYHVYVESRPIGLCVLALLRLRQAAQGHRVAWWELAAT